MKKNLEQVTVEEMMSRNVYSANLDHRWVDVARKMSAKGIHHIVVVDENHDPVGMMSSYDFLSCAFDKEGSLRDKKLRESPHERKLMTIKPGQKLPEVVSLMNSHNIDSLVVLNDENRMVGIITSRDVMTTLFTEE